MNDIGHECAWITLCMNYNAALVCDWCVSIRAHLFQGMCGVWGLLRVQMWVSVWRVDRGVVRRAGRQAVTQAVRPSWWIEWGDIIKFTEKVSIGIDWQKLPCPNDQWFLLLVHSLLMSVYAARNRGTWWLRVLGPVHKQTVLQEYWHTAQLRECCPYACRTRRMSATCSCVWCGSPDSSWWGFAWLMSWYEYSWMAIKREVSNNGMKIAKNE